MSFSIEGMGANYNVGTAQSSKTAQPSQPSQVNQSESVTKISDSEQQDPKEESKSTSSETVDQKQVLKQLKEQFKNTKLEIDYNEDVNRFSVSIIDKDTQKVIKEIPSEDALKLLEHTRELAGMLVDEKR